MVQAHTGALPRRGRVRWALVALAALAILLVEGGSYARLWIVAHRPVLTPEQQLQHAQSLVPFGLREPTWLPGGVHLAQVTYCAPCDPANGQSQVWLEYAGLGATGSWETLELSEANFHTIYHLSEYEDASGRLRMADEQTYPIDLQGVGAVATVAMASTANGPQVLMVAVTWTRDGIEYRVESTGGPAGPASIDDLEQVAKSV